LRESEEYLSWRVWMEVWIVEGEGGVPVLEGVD
jgi:hypothetical protein